MTDKFDPKATPECDNSSVEEVEIRGKTWLMVHITLAEELECRARAAEEKLKIAIKALKDFEDYPRIADALDRIEVVGK